MNIAHLAPNHIQLQNFCDCSLSKSARLFLKLITIFVFTLPQPLIAAPLIQRIGAPLAHAWGMDFLDNKQLFVTERGGAVYLIDLQTGDRSNVNNLPAVRAERQGGMLDIAVWRDPANDRVSVYLCYSRPDGKNTVTAIDKAGFDGTSLTNRETIFQANNPSRSSVHFGCRLALDKDFLYASLGERGERQDAQNGNLHAGAIIRLAHDGSIPISNPKKPGWAPELLSKGHRNPQGMAIHPETGALWTHEHGPRGGDEINIIKAGENYGWPKVSHGREYFGPSIGSGKTAPGLTDPIWVWTPSIAPSGMAFYQGAMFDYLSGHLLVGSLKLKRLYLIILEGGLPVREAIMMDGTIGRVRDVAVAYDGSILLLSDEEDGGLYRIAEAGQ
jgi:glucose/arabinose dehydrogenase